MTVLYVLLAGFVLFLSVVAPFVYRHKLYYHFAVVDDGKLYRCGKLSMHGLKTIVRKFGIKTVVCLLEERCDSQKWLVNQKSFYANNGINYYSLPIGSAPPPQWLKNL